MARVLRRIREDGISVLVVEQNVRDILPLSDRATVLEGGVVVLEGTGAELLRDPRVEAAYLGSHAAREAPAWT